MGSPLWLPYIFLFYSSLFKFKSSCLILYFRLLSDICQDTTIYIENVTIHCIEASETKKTPGPANSSDSNQQRRVFAQIKLSNG